MKVVAVVAAVTTVTVAGAAHGEPVVSPPLYRTGNMRVAVACADFVATPDTGLAVTLDGAPLPALRTNGAPSVITNEDGSSSSTWAATDIGYLVEPGKHRVSLAAPGCASTDLEITAPFDHAELVTGRLAVADTELASPTGAPDGVGLVLGARRGPPLLGPADHTLGGYSTHYAYDDTRSTGGWFGLTYEHRNFAFAFDTRFTVNAVAGTATQTAAIGALDPRAHPFAGDAYGAAMTLRLGPRLSLGHVSLAAGSGIGGELWIVSTRLVDTMVTTADAPDTVDASWLLPLWASATIKTSCDWGLHALVEIDAHPTALSSSGLALGAGVTYQPSSACSAAPGVTVAPF
jgi:opacity protein-like surface antigen